MSQPAWAGKGAASGRCDGAAGQLGGAAASSLALLMATDPLPLLQPTTFARVARQARCRRRRAPAWLVSLLGTGLAPRAAGLPAGLGAGGRGTTPPATLEWTTARCGARRRCAACIGGHVGALHSILHPHLGGLRRTEACASAGPPCPQNQHQRRLLLPQTLRVPKAVSDQEGVQVEVTRLLVASYFDIVRKNLQVHSLSLSLDGWDWSRAGSGM